MYTPYSPKDWTRDASKSDARRAGRSSRHGARSHNAPLLPSFLVCLKFIAAAFGAVLATLALGAAVGAAAGVFFGRLPVAALAPLLLLLAAGAEAVVRWMEEEGDGFDPNRSWHSPRCGLAGALAAGGALVLALPPALRALAALARATLSGSMLGPAFRLLVWRPPLWVAALETVALVGALAAGGEPALATVLTHPAAWWLGPGGGGLWGSFAGLVGLVGVLAAGRGAGTRAEVVTAACVTAALPLAVAAAARYGLGWLGRCIAAGLCWYALVGLCARGAASAATACTRPFLPAEAAPGAPAAVARVLAAGDHFEVLGVGRAASDAEIKAAWRAIVLVVHPDKVGDAPGAAVATSRVSDAWEALKTGAGRVAHERELADAAADAAKAAAAADRAAAAATSPTPSPRRHHRAPCDDDSPGGSIPTPCDCAAGRHHLHPTRRPLAAPCPVHRVVHELREGDIWCEGGGGRGQQRGSKKKRASRVERASYFRIIDGTVFDVTDAVSCPHSVVRRMVWGRRGECVLANRR